MKYKVLEILSCFWFLAVIAMPIHSNLGGGNTARETAAIDCNALGYVADGLIAMWDGEFNSVDEDGNLCHDPMAEIWLDLSGNGHDIAIPSNGATWLDDSIYLVRSALHTQLPEINRIQFTIESVGESSGNQGALIWMKNPTWNGGALICL